MRGAAKASLKAGKFVVNTSGKLVKTGARTVKHARMTPEERKAAKKKEKRKDRTKKGIKKTGGAAVKVTGRVISSGFILLVGLIEDFFVLLIIVLLILALILVVCIVTIFGTFSGVMSSDISSTSTGSSSYTIGGPGGSKTGTVVKITDPTTYDWWGNRDQNMLLLTDNWEKDIYQYIMIGYDLERYENENYSESDDYKYGYLNGEYIVAFSGFESGILSGMDDCMYVCKDDRYYEKRRDLATFLFYPAATNFCTRYDYYGDVPLGIGYVYAVNQKDASWGHYQVSNIAKELFSNRNTLVKNGTCVAQDNTNGYSKGDAINRDWTDDELFVLLSLPGGLRYSWESKRESLKGNGDTGNQIGGYLEKFGKENSVRSRDEISGRLTYCLHHGETWDNVRNTKAPLLLTAMYCYGDEGFDSWWVTDSSGNIDKSIISGMTEHANTILAKTGLDGYTIHVIHDGKEEKIESNGVLQYLKEYIKKAGLESEYNILMARGLEGGTSSNINIWACCNQTLIGNDMVKYLIDKLGIVFESEDGEVYDNGGVSFSKDITKTQQNVRALQIELLAKGGTNYNEVNDVEKEAANLRSSKGYVYSQYTDNSNPGGEYCGLLGTAWCAATVSYTLDHAYVNGKDVSVGNALREKGVIVNNGTDTFKWPKVKDGGADFHATGMARRNTGSYEKDINVNSDTYRIFNNKYARVHFTNTDMSRGAYNGLIANYPLGDTVNSPQVAYGQDGKIIVAKESKYVPRLGDIVIMLGMDSSYGFGHVGMVLDYDSSNDKVITIEGNTGSGVYAVRSRNYSSIYWFIEIDYVGLEKAYGVSSTSSTTDESGVFKVDSFVKDKIKTGLTSLDSKTKKFIDVSVDGTSCKVTTYEKSANDKWDIGPVSLSEGYVGRNGLASSASNSYEGSNMTPYGTYYCRTGFGNGTKDSLGIKMKTWYNIGDGGTHIWSGSGTSAGFDGGEGIEINKYYNKSINGGTGAENLTSYVGYAYKYAMFIEYNSGKGAKPGGGSAFFLHVGSQSTAGCVAISESDMLKIAQWTDDNTVICIHNSDEVIGRQSSKQNSNNSQ